MTIEDLNKEREENRLLEQQQIGLFTKFVRQKRERFDFADTTHWIALNKKEEDFLILCDTFTKWHNAINLEDKRRNELLDLIQTVWRLQSYCINIETIIQSSVAEYVTSEKRNLELVTENRRKELEFILTEKKYLSKIEELGKEIEFITKKS